MRVFVDGDVMGIELPDGHYLHEVAKGLAKRRWLPARKIWHFPPTLVLLEHVKKWMPGLEWTAEADSILAEARKKEEHRQFIASGQFDFSQIQLAGPFKNEPWEHQRKALALGQDQDEFAYFMDQGTGKTKVILDDAAHNFRQGVIDCLLVIAPNAVKTNWVNPDEDLKDPDTHDEVTKHLAPDIPFIKAAWFASPTGNAKLNWKRLWERLHDKSKLLVVATNVDGLQSPKVQAMLAELVGERKVMIAVDESTRIANRTSKRHKVCRDIRTFCPRARIASGTPVLKSPLKAYGQMAFLNPDILGFSTYTEFQARYAVMNPNIPGHAVRFVNVEELSEKMAGVSFRVRKDECLDLPPKLYQKRQVWLSPEQARHYAEMNYELVTYLDQQHKVVASNVMTQLTRLQQIVAGYLPLIDPETFEVKGLQRIGNDVSPKVAEALDIVQEFDGKFVIFCRFTFEVDEMLDALRKAGIFAVRFDGQVSDKNKVANRIAFQSDPNVQGMVAQIDSCDVGLNLFAGSLAIYMTNTFDTEKRLQSEDRLHRAGQVKNVTYIDLVAPKTIDERVRRVLLANKSISDVVMKDGYRAWFT